MARNLIVQILLISALAGIALFFFFSRETQAYSAPSYRATDTLSEYYAMNNLTAFLGLIRWTESGNRYDVIAGNVTFTDFREHPFILNPSRAKPLGTTASGAYQMVVGTWIMARNALGLTDFSPASQDAAAIWILQNKRKGAYDAVIRGDLHGAMQLLSGEWEAFEKMLAGRYPITIAQAQTFFTDNGGNIA